MRLRDLFGPGSAVPSRRYAPLPQEGFMRVVGESHYQATLKRLVGRCTPGVEGRPSFAVALVREPNNPHDANAVAVVSEIGTVGYLPREDAMRYGRTLEALQRDGYDGGSCIGLLNGGDRDRPSLGVTLCISYPEDCERHFGI